MLIDSIDSSIDESISILILIPILIVLIPVLILKYCGPAWVILTSLSIRLQKILLQGTSRLSWVAGLTG
jgi:hypothetical protein